MSIKVAVRNGQSKIQKWALIDDQDAHIVLPYKWHLDTGGYARRHSGKEERPIHGVAVKMHRVILKTPLGMCTDHINGDKLDNRRENLRVATKSQNNRNCGIRKDNTTGAKGVDLQKRFGKYRARIFCNGRSHALGYFRTLEEARRAYLDALPKFHGEFARA